MLIVYFHSWLEQPSISIQIKTQAAKKPKPFDRKAGFEFPGTSVQYKIKWQEDLSLVNDSFGQVPV